MAQDNPKKELYGLRFTEPPVGLGARDRDLADSMIDQPEIPSPVEYGDIDQAFTRWVEGSVNMETPDVPSVPTFTLYSGERFSEYSQTWKHTDREGNLLMDFKTVTRENNPKGGNNQGGDYNIPGDRRYTVLMRDIVDETGVDCYEVHTMGQPFCVDLKYSLSYVTSKFERLNRFNERINSLFRSRQCYINPNGHFIPMILDSISDGTEYTIDQRRFFVQTASITAMAYIIERSSFEVRRVPKRTIVGAGIDLNGDDTVNFSDIEGVEHMTLTFPPKRGRIRFSLEEPYVTAFSSSTNMRGMKVFLDGIEVANPKDGFTIPASIECEVRATANDPSKNIVIVI